MEQEHFLIEGKYITFVLGREEYGVSLNKVREILGPEGLQDSEQTDPCVRGVMKIRNCKDSGFGFALPVRLRDRFHPKREARGFSHNPLDWIAC